MFIEMARPRLNRRDRPLPVFLLVMGGIVEGSGGVALVVVGDAL